MGTSEIVGWAGVAVASVALIAYGAWQIWMAVKR